MKFITFPQKDYINTAKFQVNHIINGLKLVEYVTKSKKSTQTAPDSKGSAGVSSALFSWKTPFRFVFVRIQFCLFICETLQTAYGGFKKPLDQNLKGFDFLLDLSFFV